MRQQWLDKQRGKLAEYAQTKAMREQAKRRDEAEAKDRDLQERFRATQKNELQKQKIQMYKEMKAHQILELQMREQAVIAASRGRKAGSYSDREMI